MKRNFLFILLVFFVFKINAQTTWLVTTTADAGSGSLRNAVAKAAAGDIIRIDPTTFRGSGINIITLTSGEIAFNTNNLIFKGFYNANGDTVKISGNNTSRIFDIINANYNVLDSMVITNGNSNDNGGAIIITGSSKDSMLVSNSIISNSISNGNYYGGGGIFADSNIVNIKVINSIFYNNSAANALGGGIFALNNLTVNNSTISDNSAFYSGGGIFAGNSTIKNSTITGNTAVNSSGGGVSGINITVINSTIVGNTAGLSGYGGGIYGSPITVTSSIVANNTGGDIFDYNANFSSITSGGYNIFTDYPSGTASTDQTGASSTCLQLGPLQNNGGNTFTMLPLAGSVAINRGNPTDNSIAQNGIAPHGIRDVGAAESMLNNSIYYDTVLTSVCNGYIFGDSIYYTNGDYMDTLYSSGGCDSVVSLHLILLPITIIHDTVTVATNCNGYVFGNETYFSSGDYKDTLYSVGGCDSSIIDLHLTIPPIVINYDTVISTACQSPYYFDGNHTYSTSGDYMDTLTSVSGCDSILSLHYVVNPGKSDIVTTLADSGPGSLRATIASACYGDTIRFAPSLISGGSSTITLTSGPLVTGTNLVIKGLYNSKGDTLYLSGNNTSAIFNFPTATYEVLDSMVLINGNSSNDGGAINMAGDLVYDTDSLFVNNSIILNCTSTSTINGGGAIFAAANVAAITINNSIISNNSAVGSSGGGIFTRASVIINGSTINNNFATYSGGGIIASNNVIVNNSIVNNNSITLTLNSFGSTGGGISADNITTTNSTISNNSGSYGGALNAYNDVIINNSTINNNFTFSDIIFANYNATITNSTIANNSASNGNGVINTGNLQITNSTIVNNTGTNYSITGDSITIRVVS